MLLLCLACAGAQPVPVSPSTGRKRNRERGASKSRWIASCVINFDSGLYKPASWVATVQGLLRSYWPHMLLERRPVLVSLG